MGKNLAIIKPNGVKIDVTDYLEKFSVTKELMQIDLVEVSLKSDIALDIDVFDYIVVNNQKYTINVEPKTKKVSNTRFEYDINFEGAIYELKDVKFFDLDKEKASFQESFDLAGDFYLFISVVVNNLKRKFGESVQVKNFVNDIDKQITFNDDDCLSALIRICQDYNKEFFVYRENGIVTIDFISVGREFPMPLAYGFEKGLYALDKSNAGDENLCNKAYVRGGTDNIPLGYRGYKDELLMPTDITAAYKKLELEVQGYTPEEKEKNKYLVEFVNDKNNQINSEFFTDAKSLQNGLKEKFIRIEDIYPNRTGTIDFVDNSKRIVGDATMFDLNARDEKGNTKYLVAGKKAVMFVKTGNLAGYTFEISSYNTAKKEFVLMPYTAQNGDKYPSNEFLAYQFKKGDTYTLLEINLPDSYLNDAEYLLFKKAAEEFQIIKHRKREYTLNIDEFFAKELSDVYGFFVKEGDYVTVIDKQLNVNDKVRVKGFTFDVLNDTYDINLSDTIVFNTVSTATRDISKIESILKNQGIDSVNKSKSGVRAISELKANIFDTDGYFDNVNIKPLSIDTSLLSVGARSQYISTNLVFTVNYQNNANRISYTSASVFSQTLERIWNVVGKEETIGDNEFIYLYAKANKNNTDATLLFTKEKIEFDSNPTHYHFLLGMLHSVVDGKRILSLTYGSTTIQGGLVKTGRISSNDGKTVFDLDTGVITGKIVFTNDSPALGQIDDKIKEATDKVVDEINEQIKGLDKSSEAYAIAQNVPRLNSEKAGLDARYNEVYNNAKLTGTAKTDLAAKKTAYNSAFSNVVSYINAIISDKEITEAEKIELNKRMVAYDTALSNLTKSLEIASNSIEQKNISDTKADLTTDINGVKTDLKNTEKSLNEAIKDGVLTAQEKAELNTLLQSLKGSKLTLDKRVSYALTLDADAAVKTDVTNKKIAFDTAHTNLNNTLVTLLAKDTVTEAEKKDLDNKFNAYNTALSNLEEALDKLIQNVENKAINNIEFGGTNLMLDTALTHIGSGAWSSLPNRINYDGYICVQQGYGWSINYTFSKLEKGIYTISFMAKEDTNTLSRARVNIEGGVSFNHISRNSLKDWSKITYTFELKENASNIRFFFLNGDASTGNANVKFRSFKLEKGNKASDWSPAPEDFKNDIKNATDGLRDEVNGAIKDGIISESEAQAIGSKLSALATQKKSIDEQYNNIYNNAKLTGTAKTDLASKKTAYNAAYTALVNKINAVVAAKVVTVADNTQLNNLFNTHDNSLADVLKSFDIARMAIEDFSIKQATDSLRNEVNGAIKDGIIDEAEAQAIGSKLSALATQKAGVDAQYNEVYASVYLKGTAKTDLASKKTTYNTAYNALVAKINAVVAAKVVTVSDKAILNNLFDAHDASLAAVLKALDVARQSIEDEKINNIEFGGTNLMLDTALTHIGSGAWSSLPNRINYDGYICVQQGYGWSINYTFSKLEKGIYTISFMAKEDTNTLSRARVSIEGGVSFNHISRNSLKDWSKITYTFELKENASNIRFFFLNGDASTGNANVKFRSFKLEKGNKASDWSPAPEDFKNDIKNATDGLRDEVNGAIKDGIISESEAQAIGSKLSALATQKKSIDEQYNNIYNNAKLTGTAKTDLASKKTAYNAAYTALVNKINAVVAAKVVTVADNTQLNNLFNTHDNSLADVLKSFDIARMAIEDFSIKQATDSLRNEVNGAIKDGIIDEAEAQAIGSKLSALATQKAGVDAQYNEVYASVYLKGTAKTDLASKKTTYNTAYNALVAKINAVVAAKVVTVSDKAILNNLFDAHDASLAAVLKALDVARQSIEDEKINNIEFGGTNLMLNTSKDNKTVTFASWNYYPNGNIEGLVPCMSGENYVSSVILSNSNKKVGVSIFEYNSNKQLIKENNTSIDVNAGATGKAICQIKTSSETKYINTLIRRKESIDNINTTVTFSSFKLEKGNKPSDWSPAPEDLGIDYEEIENLKTTTARIENITSFLDTTLDGNVVGTGTLLVGDASGNQKAGITGVAGSPANQVKKRRVVFWAGDTFANREIAPVRIWDDGMIEVTNAKVKGEIESSKGKISSFTIADEFMTSERQMYDNTKSIMKLGGGGLQVDYMKNNTLIGKIDTTGEMRWQELYNIMEIKSIGVSSQNVGYSSLFLESSNGHALRTKGRVLHDGDFVVSALDDGIALFAQYLSISNGSSNGVGMTKTIYYRASDSSNRKMNFINGIMVSDDRM